MREAGLDGEGRRSRWEGEEWEARVEQQGRAGSRGEPPAGGGGWVEEEKEEEDRDPRAGEGCRVRAGEWRSPQAVAAPAAASVGLCGQNYKPQIFPVFHSSEDRI